MDAEEQEPFAALAEESLRKNESFGQMFNEAARDPSIVFRHNFGCFAQPGFHGNVCKDDIVGPARASDTVGSAQ